MPEPRGHGRLRAKVFPANDTQHPRDAQLVAVCGPYLGVPPGVLPEYEKGARTRVAARSPFARQTRPPQSRAVRGASTSSPRGPSYCEVAADENS